MTKCKITTIIFSLLLISTIMGGNISLYASVSSDSSNDIIGYQDGWPQYIGGEICSSPVFTDINDDGLLEVIIGSGLGTGINKLYVFNYNGTVVDGWPQQTNSGLESSPAVGDIDGDTFPDVIGGTTDGDMYVWNITGELLDGFPYQTDNSFVLNSTASLIDPDADDDLEILVATIEGDIYAWDLPGTFDLEAIHWGMPRHDYRNTGNYGTVW